MWQGSILSIEVRRVQHSIYAQQIQCRRFCLVENTKSAQMLLRSRIGERSCRHWP